MTETPEHDDALDRRVKDALSHDPGEAYFASFADRVVGKIEAQSAAPATRRATGGSRWFGSPRNLAWLGSAAALVLVSGVAFVLMRQQPGTPAGLVLGGDVQKQSAPLPQAQGPGPAPLAKEKHDDTAEEAAPSAMDAVPPASPPVAVRVPADETFRQVPAEGEAAKSRAAQETRAREVRRDQATGEMIPVPSRVDSRLLERDQATKPEPTTPQQKMLDMKRRAIGSMGKAPAAEGTTKSSADGLADRVSRQPAPPSPVLEEREAFARHCGTVRDPQGRGLAGATVVLVETGASATSGPDGSFCLDGPASATTLRVLSVGFRSRELSIDRAAPSGALAVTLDPVETVGGKPAGGLARSERGSALDLGATAKGSAWGGESALASALATRATQRVARARRDATAASWDAAAGDWTAALAAMRATPAQIEARARLAEARYEAWRAEPSATRAARWHEARDAFATAAPSDARLASEPWLKAGAIPR